MCLNRGRLLSCFLLGVTQPSSSFPLLGVAEQLDSVPPPVCGGNDGELHDDWGDHSFSRSGVGCSCSGGERVLETRDEIIFFIGTFVLFFSLRHSSSAPGCCFFLLSNFWPLVILWCCVLFFIEADVCLVTACQRWQRELCEGGFRT